jgi:hypothetical protein
MKKYSIGVAAKRAGIGGIWGVVVCFALIVLSPYLPEPAGSQVKEVSQSILYMILAGLGIGGGVVYDTVRYNKTKNEPQD